MGTTQGNGGGAAGAAIETFIARWQGRDGGQERANYAMFLRELCDVLGLQPPDPAGDPEMNDYVFERVVKEPGRDGTVSSRRIDLYKRGSFVLEAKQSRQQKGGDKEVPGQTELFLTDTASRGRRGADRAWDVLMLNARRQAEDYVRLLPSGHEPPPFVIVCDVPFIGGKDIRARLGDDYVRTLWSAHPHMNESADFVMYWWDRAAELLTRKGSVLRQFGLVTTNSISQLFQRRVMEAHLQAKLPVSIIMAIADHPWTEASADAAAVRIAMTVVAAGACEGTLREVVREAALDTDEPIIVFAERSGIINSDLTVGVDVTTVVALKANDGVCSPGVKLHGAGFIVTPQKAEHLGLGGRPGLGKHIRQYRNGRDLMARPRGVMVIDLDGLGADEVRVRFPEVYQHLALTVKPERDSNNEEYRRVNWWLFGRRNTLMRGFTAALRRYVATGETAKHRVFQFLDASILPDNKLIAIGLDDAFALGVLSSRIHVTWALRAGGWLGVGNDPVYVKSRCFDPFPFPVADHLQQQRVRVIAESLDAHRKRVLSDQAHLTLTGLYNVLEKLRAGVMPDALEPTDRRIFDDGLVLILKELHDRLDVAVADAYGWPVDLPDEDILAHLVALNKERVREEARGHVR